MINMASVSNNYEINVAKNGTHWCKIQLPDTFEVEAEKKLKQIREIFGEEYHISMTYWNCYGNIKDGWE